MLTRRRFFGGAAGAGAGLVIGPSTFAQEFAERGRLLVNDVHSQLNPTYVHEVVKPNGLAGVQEAVARARDTGRRVSIAGGRHAMGGQQFGTDTMLLDSRSLNRVLAFDEQRGLVEVEAGIQWPELIAHLIEVQDAASPQWAIIQKQTGADRLCLGGALGSNVHGRGLTFKPIVADVESFRLVNAAGDAKLCSRSENAELFRLAIGGYGLFGVIASATLRLMPRRKLQRIVEIIDTDDLIPAFERRIADGYLYGDCQFSIDARSEDFLKRGVFSCYRPVDERHFSTSNAVTMPRSSSRATGTGTTTKCSLPNEAGRIARRRRIHTCSIRLATASSCWNESTRSECAAVERAREGRIP
jgi:FAD/FMN-containing dehydrogenase